MNFSEEYRQLESQMASLAASDGDVYLPNPAPGGKVDYIFICMEPSLKGWADNKHEAIEKVRNGFRNFVGGIEPMLLHFSIRKYLMSAADKYHITDFSKGAMTLECANLQRTDRYGRWYSLLIDEIGLLSKPNTIIISVGAAVEEHLRKFGFKKPIKRITHYSPLAAGARSRLAASRRAQFELFRSTVDIQELRTIVQRAIEDSGVPPVFANEAKAQFDKLDLDKSPKDTYRKLLFAYNVEFKEIVN